MQADQNEKITTFSSDMGLHILDLRDNIYSSGSQE